MSKEQRKTEDRSKFEVLIINKGERIPYAFGRKESENRFEKKDIWPAGVALNRS